MDNNILTLRQLEEQKLKSLDLRYETIKNNLIKQGFEETPHPEVLIFKSILNFSVKVHLEREATPYLEYDYYDVAEQCMVSELSCDENYINCDISQVENEAILLVRAMINGEYPEY